MTDAAYNAKKWLNRLIELYEAAEKTKRAIEVCEDRINRAVSSYENFGRGQTDLIVKQQQREDALIGYSELQAKYEHQYFDFVRQELITLNLIEKIDDTRARAILIDRYINRNSVLNMSKDKSYRLKKTQFFQAHNEALAMLAELLEQAEPIATIDAEEKLYKYMERKK